MEFGNTHSSCFCHVQSSSIHNSGHTASAPTHPLNRSQSMDLDSALNELGMLSSICEGKQQYLAERRRKEMMNTNRERKISEPVSCSKSSKNVTTPNNSPIKGYQIVQINPTFVTNFSTAINSTSPVKLDSNCSLVENGSKYNQENMELEYHSKRLSRIRLSRSRRFKKPYDMPWLERHSIDTCYPSLSNHLSSDTSQSDLNNSNPGSNSLYSTPEKQQPLQGISERNVLSNSTTPDRPTCRGDGNGNSSTTNKVQGQFSRSRSLDELDFAKLKVAESEAKNYIQEKREIENMSHHLQNLNVNE